MQGYSTEGFCWACLPSFSASTKMPLAQFGRGGDVSLPPGSPHTDVWWLEVSLCAEAGGALGCFGLQGLLQLWGTFVPQGSWWGRGYPGFTLSQGEQTCDEGPSFASPITPEGSWLVERANVWSFPFLPPNDLHNARATDPLSSLLNRAQFRHNYLQLSFTKTLVV